MGTTRAVYIARVNRTYYDTAANIAALPAGQLRIGELAFETDTGILKRWNGAAWQSISEPFPSGGVIEWTGLIADIPAGYVICDGNSGTQNLLGRFLQGVATAATNPGATGGATAKTTSGHVHTNPNTDNDSTAPTGNRLVDVTAASVDVASNSHTHNHAHTQGNTGNETDGIIDIRPLFFDVAFLMKT